jgi:hypothetical protein
MRTTPVRVLVLYTRSLGFLPYTDPLDEETTSKAKRCPQHNQAPRLDRKSLKKKPTARRLAFLAFASSCSCFFFFVLLPYCGLLDIRRADPLVVGPGRRGVGGVYLQFRGAVASSSFFLLLAVVIVSVQFCIVLYLFSFV